MESSSGRALSSGFARETSSAPLQAECAVEYVKDLFGQVHGECWYGADVSMDSPGLWRVRAARCQDAWQ